MDHTSKTQYGSLTITPEALDRLQGLVGRVNKIAIGMGIPESTTRITGASIAQYGLLLIDILVTNYEKAQRGEITLQDKEKKAYETHLQRLIVSKRNDIVQ